MRRFLLVALLIFFVAIFRIAAADARVFQKKDPRPLELIAVNGESLALQNEIIDRFCLVRFDTQKILNDYLRQPEKFFAGKPCAYNPAWHTIVKVESQVLYLVNGGDTYALLPARNFMEKLGKEYHDEFRLKMKITDTLRTEEEQRKLVLQQKTKADGSTPERRSAHPTGVPFDISKKNIFGLQLSGRQIRWLRERLIAYQREGKIIAVEEIYNNAFHVMVCPNWETGKCVEL